MAEADPPLLPASGGLPAANAPAAASMIISNTRFIMLMPRALIICAEKTRQGAHHRLHGQNVYEKVAVPEARLRQGESLFSIHQDYNRFLFFFRHAMELIYA